MHNVKCNIYRIKICIKLAVVCSVDVIWLPYSDAVFLHSMLAALKKPLLFKFSIGGSEHKCTYLLTYLFTFPVIIIVFFYYWRL